MKSGAVGQCFVVSVKGGKRTLRNGKTAHAKSSVQNVRMLTLGVRYRPDRFGQFDITLLNEIARVGEIWPC